MHKGTITRLSLLLPAVVSYTLAIQGCGGGDHKDNTNNDENPTSNTLSSNIWMASDCKPDNNNVYYKNLYQFNANGEFLIGYQDFQDTSCTSRKNETALPDNVQATFTIRGSETLQDGTSGTKVIFLFKNDSIDGYFTLTNQNTLCFTDNYSFQTGNNGFSTNSSSTIDYNHCLSVHSAANNSNPNPSPNPNPNPNPHNSNLEGMWHLTTSCYTSNAAGTLQFIVKYTPDNKILYATLPFASDNCSGTPSTSSTFMEFEPPLQYTILGETTLPDGTQGYNLQYRDASGTDDGYFTFDAQNNLCLSYNLGFEENISTDIDYENCLVRLNTGN